MAPDYIGIDFGTCNCSVAAWVNNQAELIPVDDNSDILFPKAKATLRNSDENQKVVVRKKHNSLPVFLAENSDLLALNKNGKKNAIRYSYEAV